MLSEPLEVELQGLKPIFRRMGHGFIFGIKFHVRRVLSEDCWMVHWFGESLDAEGLSLGCRRDEA